MHNEIKHSSGNILSHYASQKAKQMAVGKKEMSHPSTWDLAVEELVKDFRSLNTNAILKYFLPRAAFETTPCALWS